MEAASDLVARTAPFRVEAKPLFVWYSLDLALLAVVISIVVGALHWFDQPSVGARNGLILLGGAGSVMRTVQLGAHLKRARRAPWWRFDVRVAVRHEALHVEREGHPLETISFSAISRGKRAGYALILELRNGQMLAIPHRAFTTTDECDQAYRHLDSRVRIGQEFHPGAGG